MKRGGTTLSDVALAAGVSPSTVSRSFSNPDLLSPETRLHVLGVASKMNYVPDRLAQGLAKGITGNFGLVVPDVMNPFFPPFIKGAQARAREHDRDVFLADSDEDSIVESVLLGRLSKRVDGLLLCSSRLSEEPLLALSKEMPVVLFNRAVPGITSVVFDMRDGMRQAGGHLASLGHKRIGYVGGPAHSWADEARRIGLREAAEQFSLSIVDLGPHVPTWEAGIQAADTVLASSVTAVVAFDDTMAIGIMSRLITRGVTVPDEISVVGHDNIGMATMCHPSLTTVEAKCATAGRVATDLLLRMPTTGSAGEIAPTSETSQVLPVQLIIRNSTDRARDRELPQGA